MASDDDTRTGKDRDAPPFSNLRDSVSQIWLAGLGAFARAQEEGSKVFDSLVREGAEMQRRTQSAAGEKMAAAGSRVSDFAQDVSARASESWDKVEGRMEQGLAQGLQRMGVPTRRDMEALEARVASLERELERLLARGERTVGREEPGFTREERTGE